RSGKASSCSEADAQRFATAAVLRTNTSVLQRLRREGQIRMQRRSARGPEKSNRRAGLSFSELKIKERSFFADVGECDAKQNADGGCGVKFSEMAKGGCRIGIAVHYVVCRVQRLARCSVEPGGGKSDDCRYREIDTQIP